MNANTPESLPGDRSSLCKLLTLRLEGESDIVTARRRAQQLAALLGFDHQDQVRVATSTSEIARNALQYGGGGKVELSVEPTDPLLFLVKVIDNGPGIADIGAILEGRFQSRNGMGIGITGTRKLMDRFELESNPGQGTAVSFGKFLRLGTRTLDLDEIARALDVALRESPRGPYDELQQQNRELLDALSAVRKREAELRQRESELSRLNQELEETNRGVVALYAELDDKAVALRKSDEIKSRFLSHMSHEFRTPLNSILALSDLLLARVDGYLAPEQEKQVGFVKRAAQELFEMVNDLLDLAKVDAGKVDIHNAPVEVSKLFGALRGMMRPLATHEAVMLVFEETPHPITLQTDEGKLAQILRNLISNALKFTERGEIHVSAKREPRAVVFTVADSGIGIAPSDIDLIFQEFAQVENPLQHKTKGTGLGLPLSRKLAELLGGKLTVSSAIGIGSTFTVMLPSDSHAVDKQFQTLGRGLPSDTGELEADAADKSADSILVIDDEDVARYLIGQLLRGTGYLMTEASGGIEGLERARFDHPRLILLDLSMPDRSGFEVLKELKADCMTKDIPVVVHTSRTLGPEDLGRLGGLHAALLPKKLVNREQALEVIRHVLDEPYSFAGSEAGIKGA